MESRPVHVTRHPETLLPDDNRVIARYFDLHSRSRIKAMIKRVLRIPDAQVPQLLAEVKRDFGVRHRDVEQIFMDNYRSVASYCDADAELTEERRYLIGACFTMEYSIEAAALFNPSIVPHPDQSGLDPGSVRFLMSLRATGEGHISSIVFRRGVIATEGAMSFDTPPRYAFCAKPIPKPSFDRREFLHQLMEMGAPEELAISILIRLPDPFAAKDLHQITEEIRQSPDTPGPLRNLANDMDWASRAEYELRYPSDCLPGEIVIFPATESERRGMEDLRLVRLMESNGRARYLGTYTAYDGKRTFPMMLETVDFTTFRVSRIIGKYARNKGFALFPRKVAGQYVMVARCDGVNLYLLASENLHEWNTGRKLMGPQEPWEVSYIGNCGSPLETEAGWLLLTHGVGPVRRYCIGAVLLDKEEPQRVIGRLREPLMSPGVDEREGYVPNVLYSYGSMIHRDQLVIPYAMSDSRTAFATVSVPDLLALLIASGS